MSDSGHSGKQFEHSAGPGRDQMGTLEQPGVPMGVQRDEMCVFTAPAHKQKEAFRSGRYHAF